MSVGQVPCHCNVFKPFRILSKCGLFRLHSDSCLFIFSRRLQNQNIHLSAVDRTQLRLTKRHRVDYYRRNSTLYIKQGTTNRKFTRTICSVREGNWSIETINGDYCIPVQCLAVWALKLQSVRCPVCCGNWQLWVASDVEILMLRSIWFRWEEEVQDVVAVIIIRCLAQFGKHVVHLRAQSHQNRAMSADAITERSRRSLLFWPPNLLEQVSCLGLSGSRMDTVGIKQ
jgi:hypothetical protein